MVHLNMLKDCPVTNNNIRNAHNIYGPNLASIRGKMVRGKPKRVVTDYVESPRQFLSIHAHVTLVADVMFVNSIPLIIVNDEDGTPLPPAFKKCFLLFPKLNLTFYLPHK
jgi:hypothetical protein